jgi:hypothetical protein
MTEMKMFRAALSAFEKTASVLPGVNQVSIGIVTRAQMRSAPTWQLHGCFCGMKEKRHDQK